MSLLREAWQFIALARNEVYRRGLDGLEASARHAAREPERQAKARAVIAAVTDCLREVEQDPCTAPLPQNWVALGSALAALGPLGSAPCRECIELEDWLRSLATAYGTLVYDIVATRYRPSRRRNAFLVAAHKVEVGAGPIRDILRALEQLDKAGRALDKYRLTLAGISAHAGLGRVVVAGKHNECVPR